jgi:hypothetical protein
MCTLGDAADVNPVIKLLILIYLSTAIGFTPGGSGTVHTINT